MIRAYSDGCRKATGLGGWAYVIHYESMTHFAGGFMEGITNNYAELQAVIEICNHLIHINTKDIPISIHSDSSYFVNGFNQWMHQWRSIGWTKMSSPKGQVIANLDQWQLLHAYKDELRAKAYWVRGHNGHTENEMCDKIANFCHDHKCGIRGSILNDEDHSLGAVNIGDYIVIN